tara:strand:+ start:2678 stop:3517 length:840 start_codon:yes stop_codon:yes gene_type:complete
MKNNIITAVSMLIIIGFCASVFSVNIQKQLEEQYTYSRYIDETLGTIKRDIVSIRAASASTISRIEFSDARDSIESNKKFIEYEVNMSKKSIQKFVDKLNRDMEQLTHAVNSNAQNYKGVQGQLEFILKELHSIQILLEEEEETKNSLTSPFDSSVPSEVESKVTSVVPPSLEKKEGNTEVVKNTNNKQQCPTLVNRKSIGRSNMLQRAVNRDRKKGTYNISALFNVDTTGKATDIYIKSDNVPSNNLKKAVQTYIARLDFISDKGLFNCKMTFNLSVV